MVMNHDSDVRIVAEECELAHALLPQVLDPFLTTNFLNIVGASASSFTTSAMKASDDGVAYRVVINTDAARVTSDEAFIAVITVKNPVWVADFNTKLPDNIAIYGDAYWDAMAGVLEMRDQILRRPGTDEAEAAA